MMVDTINRRQPEATEGNIIKIISGQWRVSGNPGDVMDTILGSCIAACIRDPIAGVGGMNHFLLPGDANMNQADSSARYGVFAMESLINGILKLGGRRERLEVKVFGGGNVTKNSARIGSKNAAFIRAFLKQEGFRIMAEDLEGEWPRRVRYYPGTGKVLIRTLQRQEDMAVVEEEVRYQKTIAAQPVEGEIDLF